MIVVDASVWVAWLTATDLHHAASRRWIEDWLRMGRTLLTPELALIEVAGAIARRSGRPESGRSAAAKVLSCPTLGLYSLDGRLFRLALDLASARRLRGAHSVYVALALQQHVPLISWDREQIERASPLVRGFRPE